MSLLDRFVARDKVDPSPVHRRMKMIPTDELSMWIESTVSDVGRNAHRSTIERDPDQADAYLREAKIGASSLVELLEELERRTS